MRKKRTRINKKASFILTADWHLRDDQPICRTDNYFEAQAKKIQFIKNLSEKHNCPILCAGDLFNKAKSSKSLEIYLMNNLPKLIYTIPGQHDLPNHNIKNIIDSSIGILSTADIIPLELIELGGIHTIKVDPSIGMMHTFIQKPNDTQDKLIGGSTALSFLKKYKKYNLILTGDNHKTFVFEYEGRLLVNPGSLMRMTAGQIKHKPCIFLYYTDTNTVKQIFLPIEENVIDREHIEQEERKEERFKIFIKKLNDDYDVSLSFVKNIKKYINKNKTRQSVQNILWEVIDD
jgi:DNA repair exonuclease SbcCD nuclease subunit